VATRARPDKIGLAFPGGLAQFLRAGLLTVSSLSSVSGCTRAASLHEVGSAFAGGGEQAAARWFAEEVRPHEPALRAYLRGRFPSLTDIDDLVQETYARIFRARWAGELNEVRPYLFAVARNAAVDLCRRNHSTVVGSMAEIDPQSVVEERPDSAELVSHEQELELLHEAIRALPERCREVFTLRKLQGLSHREIAAKLGISENTIEGQISIGVFRCRQYLAQRGVPLERLKQARKERKNP
jgi:RNA polymerase sigma factor (sigma-70 family)